MAYTDEQIKELDAFACAVIEAYTADDPRQLYAAESRQAYQQYFAEVYNNLSGMRDNPRLFFESDLAMRKQWGDRIAADKARYDAARREAAQAATVEPDNIKALREQLEKAIADLEVLKSELKKPAPVTEHPTGEETADAEA